MEKGLLHGEPEAAGTLEPEHRPGNKETRRDDLRSSMDTQALACGIVDEEEGDLVVVSGKGALLQACDEVRLHALVV